MNELPEIYQTMSDPQSIADGVRLAIMYSAGFMLIVFGGAWLSIKCGAVMKRTLDRIKSFRLRLLATAFAAFMIWFAGGKHAGSVSYPRTDPLQSYLTDNGSFVTNDFVHVAYSRIIVPDSAPLVIERRRLDQTNDVDWVVHLETTIGAFPSPQDVYFAAATNWNWVVYTTWTPGPSVQTNGVWHAMWGKDRKTGLHIIPVRTAIRVDGETIATPKSKENANEDD